MASISEVEELTRQPGYRHTVDRAHGPVDGRGGIHAVGLDAALVTGLLSTLLAASFFISFVGPTFSWSDWALRPSVLYYYALPAWSAVGVLTATAIALAIASIRLTGRDLAT